MNILGKKTKKKKKTKKQKMGKILKRPVVLFCLGLDKHGAVFVPFQTPCDHCSYRQPLWICIKHCAAHCFGHSNGSGSCDVSVSNTFMFRTKHSTHRRRRPLRSLNEPRDALHRAYKTARVKVWWDDDSDSRKDVVIDNGTGMIKARPRKTVIHVLCGPLSLPQQATTV